MTRSASVVLACVLGSACAPMPTREEVCADLQGHFHEHVRVQLDLTDHAFWVDSLTAVRCEPANPCCNTRIVRFDLCPGNSRGPILLQAAPTLMLAATDYGPFLPRAYSPGSGDPITLQLGCLGCEAGVLCSPPDLGAVTAVSGTLTSMSFGGVVFEVDAL